MRETDAARKYRIVDERAAKKAIKLDPIHIRFASDEQLYNPAADMMTNDALIMSDRRTAEIEVGNDGSISLSWRFSKCLSRR